MLLPALLLQQQQPSLPPVLPGRQPPLPQVAVVAAAPGTAAAERMGRPGAAGGALRSMGTRCVKLCVPPARECSLALLPLLLAPTAQVVSSMGLRALAATAPAAALGSRGVALHPGTHQATRLGGAMPALAAVGRQVLALEVLAMWLLRVVPLAAAWLGNLPWHSFG